MSMYGDTTKKEYLYESIEYERRDRYEENLSDFIADLAAILSDFIEYHKNELSHD